MCGHGERELKVLTCYEVKQVNLNISEGVKGKHIGLHEDNLEVNTKLMLSAPLS